MVGRYPYAERIETSIDSGLEVVYNEVVQSRGRGAGIHITPLVFFETCKRCQFGVTGRLLG